MNYRETVDYLESLEPHRIRPGLDRIRALLARLGDPHAAIPSILIGGTNGKGSVSAYLDAILHEAGTSAGLYVSPHLVRFEERIRVAGAPIGEHDVAALVTEVRDAIEGMERDGGERPTYFEATTALAFLHFRCRRVPIAILEVGMGGRYDATNVVEPLACAITPVAMDHMEWLGHSLSEIADQKAGILRPDTIVVIGRQPREAEEVIRAQAARAGARPIHTSACRIRPAGGEDRFADPPVLDLTTPVRQYDGLRLALRGGHQVDNAAAAVLLAESIHELRQLTIDAGAIARGLERVNWPGRIEIVPGETDLLLDGAHNPAASGTLATYLRDHHAGRHIALVFAAMKDKPIPQMLEVLSPLVSEIIVTRLPVARGESPLVLYDMATRIHPRVVRADLVEDALEMGRRAAGPGGLCVVSGSLYLVGEMKRIGIGAPAFPPSPDAGRRRGPGSDAAPLRTEGENRSRSGST